MSELPSAEWLDQLRQQQDDLILQLDDLNGRIEAALEELHPAQGGLPPADAAAA